MDPTAEQITPQYYKEAVGNIGYARAIFVTEKPYSGMLYDMEFPQRALEASDPGLQHKPGESHMLPLDVKAARQTADKLVYNSRIEEALTWAKSVQNERAAHARSAYEQWHTAGEPPRELPFNDPRAMTASEYYNHRLDANKAGFAVIELEAHKMVSDERYQFQWATLDRQSKGAINAYSEAALADKVPNQVRKPVVDYLNDIQLINVDDTNPDHAGSIDPKDIADKRAKALTSASFLQSIKSPAFLQDLILADLDRLRSEMQSTSDQNLKAAIAPRLNTTFAAAKALGLAK